MGLPMSMNFIGRSTNLGRIDRWINLLLINSKRKTMQCLVRVLINLLISPFVFHYIHLGLQDLFPFFHCFFSPSIPKVENETNCFLNWSDCNSQGGGYFSRSTRMYLILFTKSSDKYIDNLSRSAIKISNHSRIFYINPTKNSKLVEKL